MLARVYNILNTRKKELKIVLLLSLFVLFIYNLLILSSSPLPWYDEIWFASTAHSFSTSGTFHTPVGVMQMGGHESLMYGPLYFILTSLSTDIFGWGIFQFRIVNFLAGFIGLGVLFFMLKKEFKKEISALIVILLIATDNIFSVNTHSGRMEWTALLFVLVLLALFLKDRKSTLDFIFIGICAALAVLTTPRVAILLVSVVFVILGSKKILEPKYLMNCLAGLIACVLIYSIWVFYKFGSYNEFLTYYLQGGGVKPGTKEVTLMAYIGGNFNIPVYQYPLIGVFLVSTVIYLLTIKKVYFSKLHLISILNILFFYLFVCDTGHYSAFVVPFIYVAIFCALFKTALSKKFLVPVIGVLLFLNIGILGARAMLIFSSLDERDAGIVDDLIHKNIPKGANSIGDDRFFYSVIKNDADYQTIERGSGLKKRINYQLNEYKADYLILSKDYARIKPQIVKAYLAHGAFTKIDSLIIAKSTMSKMITNYAKKILGQELNTGYNCEIYKRNLDD